MAYRIAAAVFALSTLVNLGLAARDPSWWMLPAALLGWFLADFASGVTHMLMDYRPCRPGTGLREMFFYQGSRESADYQELKRSTFAKLSPLERIVFEFKVHHPRPDALGRRALMTQIGSTILFATLAPSLLLTALGWWTPGWAIILADTILVGASFSQYFHGALHRRDNPWFIGWMRRTRLLCTPAYHQRHHDTLQCDFATINGWSNPLLNRLFDALRRRGRLADAGLVPH